MPVCKGCNKYCYSFEIIDDYCTNCLIAEIRDKLGLEKEKKSEVKTTQKYFDVEQYIHRMEPLTPFFKFFKMS